MENMVKEDVTEKDVLKDVVEDMHLSFLCLSLEDDVLDDVDMDHAFKEDVVMGDIAEEMRLLFLRMSRENDVLKVCRLGQCLHQECCHR